MNDTSHSIVNFVHAFNQLEGETKVCYTFDAGPNACLYLLEKNVKRVLSFINYVYPNDNQKTAEYVRGIGADLDEEVRDIIVLERFSNALDCLSQVPKEFTEKFTPFDNNALKYIIHTKVGDGPSRLD